MHINERPAQDFCTLDTGSGYVNFDEIEETGKGYWELKKDGETKMKLYTLDEFSSDDVQLFRDIQFERLD